MIRELEQARKIIKEQHDTYSKIYSTFNKEISKKQRYKLDLLENKLNILQRAEDIINETIKK